MMHSSVIKCLIKRLELLIRVNGGIILAKLFVENTLVHNLFIMTRIFKESFSRIHQSNSL